MGVRLNKAEADRMVVDVVAAHADALLRTARKHSHCADDAQDAYQRALEIFVRRAPDLDPDRVVGWVHTVCRHEAMALRLKRTETVADRELALEDAEAREQPSPEDHALTHERISQAAEALRTLKPQEVQALWHRSLGKTYDEIADELGWSYTKVNAAM
ncbi:RNA polymerase sigma factor [Conexibacter sp. SYSU D00693]|uniref:RNA polymerase sigma factor n=1 Tax=Conexibacter sp. SYSU D00693 TaxID=2812560 RepID=UPI00196A776B|nr:sigma-70 family RNA polymerase sigma factor [Conexibacter sp. SYSU D00693]